MDHGKHVWAPDIKEGFILGEISDFGTDTISVQPLDGSKVSCFAPFFFSSPVSIFLSVGLCLRFRFLKRLSRDDGAASLRVTQKENESIE